MSNCRFNLRILYRRQFFVKFRKQCRLIGQDNQRYLLHQSNGKKVQPNVTRSPMFSRATYLVLNLNFHFFFRYFPLFSQTLVITLVQFNDKQSKSDAYSGFHYIGAHHQVVRKRITLGKIKLTLTKFAILFGDLNLMKSSIATVSQPSSTNTEISPPKKRRGKGAIIVLSYRNSQR